ncbi:hypothetical protein ABB55_02340 [Prosthecomicrobium hirschii]|uniref:HTH gntR-type domain-containing protein n=1 Tax=Prosthecodimorpha hirschii TaxID=665126 RepID=A0A0N8GED3_9HYPH|nr:GntR family transcriptional regulator [Prosthecomicrobium hirschii]KPL51201.1 hypothetical protein ABB55_02340 [Prosthecomicrobium hirschii]
MSLSRATLADRAYTELRDRILSGRLGGGRRLLPEELAVDLDISPTPIKEALIRLEADGLVESPLRKGAFVRRFTARVVEELCEARMMIEPPSLLNAFVSGGITGEMVASLRRNLTLHARHAEGGTLDDLQMALALDREFHETLVAAADNETVSAWHAKLLCQTHTVLVCRNDSYASAIGEHAAIVDAIAEGRPQEAAEALHRHLHEAMANMLRAVRLYEERSTRRG